MKVLLVSLSNQGGGASRAVDALAHALIRNDIEVEVLVQDGIKTTYPIKIINENLFNRISFRIKNKIINWFMGFWTNPSHDYRSINFFNSHYLLRYINESDADIVNFHWIGAEMLSIEQIAQIKKPIVWFMHDAWMINGVYHVSPNDYYPYQQMNGENWLDRWCRKRKMRSYAKVPMYFISPSWWIKEKFESGPFFKDGDSCVVIRNLIDDSIWYPRPHNIAKLNLGFDDSLIHVLFIANNITTSFNKGYSFVKDLLMMCDRRVLFHFVGTDQSVEYNNVIVHGKIYDTNELALYYSAADITIVPSLSENMPYTALESILCGTPVLCFNTTGLAEMVTTGLNGYVAKKFDVDDLNRGLNFLIETKLNTRDTLPDFDSESNVKRYIETFNNIINLWQNRK